jgi:hypothetical protein
MVLDIFNTFTSGWPDESSLFDPALIDLHVYRGHFTIYPPNIKNSIRFYQLQGKISIFSVNLKRFPLLKINIYKRYP